MLQGAVQVASPGQGLLAGWYRPAKLWTHPCFLKDVVHKERVGAHSSFSVPPRAVAVPPGLPGIEFGRYRRPRDPIGLTFNPGIFDANADLSLTEHMVQDNCILVGEQATSGSRRSCAAHWARRRAIWKRGYPLDRPGKLLGMTGVYRPGDAGAGSQRPHRSRQASGTAARCGSPRPASHFIK